MSLQDVQADIQKCSKCGLCMSVCPVYKVTKNDCSVSRGLLVMLKGILDGHLKFDKKINKYLDLCLKCNACKNFCPTGIDAENIIQKAKEEYYAAHKSSFMNFCAPYIFKISMNLIKISTFLYRLLYVDKIIKLFYPILLKFSSGKKLILLNSVLERGFSKKNVCTDTKKKIKVVYFKGCVNEYINPKIKKASEYLLNKLNVEILPVKFTCCGISFLNDGNVDLFSKFAKENITKIPEDFDYFFTDCASCKYAFNLYEKYIKNEKLLEKIKKINQKSISVSEFVINNFDKIEFKENISFTFHKPCHLENIDIINKFIEKCNKAKYIQLNDYDTCCGFSGTFALKHNEISRAISKEKVKNILETKSDNIITSCPACIMGINQGLAEHNITKIIPKHLIEFLAENIV